MAHCGPSSAENAGPACGKSAEGLDAADAVIFEQTDTTTKVANKQTNYPQRNLLSVDLILDLALNHKQELPGKASGL